jgi:hypothetical protein
VLELSVGVIFTYCSESVSPNVCVLAQGEEGYNWLNGEDLPDLHYLPVLRIIYDSSLSTAMKDSRRHMQQMPNSMPCKILADMHAIL